MNNIALNLAKIHKQLPPTTQLLAVSKGQPITAIRQAIAAGQHAFGENYLQEAIPKIIALKQEDIEWHFIGAIQANKTRLIAEYFTWVHSVDRFSIAKRLNDQRPTTLLPLNICIQVNLDEENSKGGIKLSELSALALAIADLPHLQLRGLMAIPAPQTEFELQRASFHRLSVAFKNLQQQGFKIDTLSMGMSDDFMAAIAEGATIVRLGAAIFGQRNSFLV